MINEEMMTNKLVFRQCFSKQTSKRIPTSTCRKTNIFM